MRYTNWRYLYLWTYVNLYQLLECSNDVFSKMNVRCVLSITYCLYFVRFNMLFCSFFHDVCLSHINKVYLLISQPHRTDCLWRHLANAKVKLCSWKQLMPVMQPMSQSHGFVSTPSSFNPSPTSIPSDPASLLVASDVSPIPFYLYFLLCTHLRLLLCPISLHCRPQTVVNFWSTGNGGK